jgi:thiol-disulfide isomerase/thioredoxin
MLKTSLIVLLLFPLILLAQSNLFKPQLALINTKVDTINISHFILNEPLDKNFNGKFKVLEFWATWCGPCLKAVPHLNKLQKEFKDSNIVFLSFTYESPQKIAETLKKVKFETVVVCDTTKTTHRNLRIEYKGTMPLPRTVLIDDENKIIWYGEPEDLKAKLIIKFLRKELFVE